jgi:septal ring factor EnvC (AmiA/AmiB activator)
MKSFAGVSMVLAGAAASDSGSPIGKVLEMIADLEQKTIAEGDATQMAYEEVQEFCSDRQKEVSFEVKTGKATVADLKASISKSSADIDELDAKISDLAGSNAGATKELEAATDLRKKETADFAAVETDLKETIDTLSRAAGIIERNKGSFVQLTGAQGLVSALKLLEQASEVNTADANKLTALVQSYSNSEAEDQDEETGAPAAANYENQSGGIVDLLADLQSKAEDDLAAARKAESESQHNYDMKKGALSDEIKFAAKDLDEAKKSKAASEEKKAGAVGDLTSSSKDLAQDTKTLSELHADCQSKAADFEAETATRGEELKALATAKKIIKEATSLAQVSFLQESSRSSRASDVAKQVRSLAVSQESTPLARLASRMEAMLQRHSANPFGKVVGMVKDMIAKLEFEAEQEASQKAFCDKALAEANEKKTSGTTEIEKLSVKLEQGASAASNLKEEVTTLQAELAKLMAAQQEMDKIRAEENAVYTESKAELEKGLTGIKAALKVLRDYYAKQPDSGNQGAAGGIVSLLEVCESDFSKGLAEVVAVEEDAAASYDVETKDNAMTKLTKDKDVEYKQKEIASLEKTGTELTTDRDAVQEELDAVNAALASLEKQCLAKAESYASKAAKQKAEIDGLKSALESLGGASLIQRNRHLRAVKAHA